jgi:MFS family permease
MGPLGILASTLQIAYLQFVLSPEAFQEWGWHVPFWVSILLLIIALKTRLALEETPIFTALHSAKIISKTPLRDNFRDQTTRRHMFLLFFCISAGGSVLFFCVQVYTAIYLKSALKIDPQLVNTLSIFATAALFPLTIFAGALSDRLGRKPIVITGLTLGALFILPAFALLGYLASNAGQNSLALGLVLVLLSIPLALVIGPQSALLAELFPAKRRSSAATLPHNFAAGWIGGLLPLIVTWLNQTWASPLVGLWYPTVFLASAALLAIFYLPETHRSNLHH